MAQEVDHFANGAKAKIKLPKNAIVGSNAERKAAWEKLSEKEKEQHLEKFKAIVEEAKVKGLKDKKVEKLSDTVLSFNFDGKSQSRRYINAKTREVKQKNQNDNNPITQLRPIDPEPCEGCPDPDPTPPPPTGNQYSPIGYFDSIDTNSQTINGWSFDPDNPSASNDVHIYINGPAGSGTAFGVTANQPRPDVNNAYGIGGNHGFSFQIPAQYIDGQQHVVYTYGIDTGANPSTLLINSPKYFTFNNNPPPTGGDSDADGLADSFENSLADGFTPYYHISANENGGTGFATFNNSLPLSVNQLFGAVPPISHFRVKPLGFRFINGVQHGLIQLDYLSLWNKDDGLVAGGFCYGLAPLLGISLNGLLAHPLDRERSAVLVATPLVNGSYDNNFLNYRAYAFFTGAHEDTFVDKSLLFFPQEPINFGGHIELALSRSKHGTYPYNPDYLPLIPYYIIFSTYETLDLLYIYGQISIFEYLSYLYIADTLFFTCVIEHFQEQGGAFAGTRINVGELNHPINNSSFIQDSELTLKLNKLF